VKILYNKNTYLDKLFSEFIRRRAIANVGGCEKCLTPKHNTLKDNNDITPAWKSLQCSHYIGRANKTTRYDIDNGVGLCGACHIYLTSHPYEHTEWFKNHLGEEQFNLLANRMRNSHPKPDRKAIELYLKEKIKQLEDGQCG